MCMSCDVSLVRHKGLPNRVGNAGIGIALTEVRERRSFVCLAWCLYFPRVYADAGGHPVVIVVVAKFVCHHINFIANF